MIQLTPQSRVFIAIEPEDFRQGIDGLANACRQRLDADPFSGAIFVFRNRARTAIKILVYDGTGFWLCMKRLSKGKLNWWPHSESASETLSHKALQILLWNGNPIHARLPDDWRKITC
jgi:transposase